MERQKMLLCFGLWLCFVIKVMQKTDVAPTPGVCTIPDSSSMLFSPQYAGNSVTSLV